MPGDYVNFEIEDKIALVTVERPPVNALNRQVQDEIKVVFKELRLRDNTGAVIVNVVLFPGFGSNCC